MAEFVALLIGAFFIYNCYHRIKQICKREKLRELRHQKRVERNIRKLQSRD